jgi:hypothetical protein
VPSDVLLHTRLRDGDFSIRYEVQDQPNRRRYVAAPIVDPERMREALEHAAETPQPPSLSRVAAGLGCRTTTLLRRFPDLAQRVKARFQSHCAAEKDARAKHFRALVRNATFKLQEAGIYPSQHRVRQQLPKEIDMRDPVANQEWKNALAEMGLRDPNGARLVV